MTQALSTFFAQYSNAEAVLSGNKLAAIILVRIAVPTLIIVLYRQNKLNKRKAGPNFYPECMVAHGHLALRSACQSPVHLTKIQWRRNEEGPLVCLVSRSATLPIHRLSVTFQRASVLVNLNFLVETYKTFAQPRTYM